MKTTTPSSDAANFLEAVLFAYHTEDAPEIDGKTVYDFSAPFLAAVENFMTGFRRYLAARNIEIPESPRSFGGNVYFSLSGHGVGFWDDPATKHLQAALEAFSGNRYRFEEIDPSEDADGKLDLAFIPEAIAHYRARMFGCTASNLPPCAPLHELPDSEFVTGGEITSACKAAGYDVSGRIVVNDMNAWNMTVAEFLGLLHGEEVPA